MLNKVFKVGLKEMVTSNEDLNTERQSPIQISGVRVFQAEETVTTKASRICLLCLRGGKEASGLGGESMENSGT